MGREQRDTMATHSTATRQDIDRILQLVLGARTPTDELALLRAALRRYVETGDPEEAVAWAARHIANSIA